MEGLRVPFLIAALVVMLLVVGAELAASLFFGITATAGSSPPGVGISSMAMVDGELLFMTFLMALPLLITDRVQGKVQGIATLIVMILLLLAAIVAVILVFILLMTMVGLLLAVPFGTIAYLALFGHFSTGTAATILGILFMLKVAFAICLVAAHQGFLKMKGLVFLTLTSLLCGIIVSFLHGLVPIFLVSITDAIGGLVLIIIAIIWALVLAIGSLPAIFKALGRA